MSEVPALHIRNVPAVVVETLRQRAVRNGRSLNAEVLRVLTSSAEREQQDAPITKRLAELAARVNLPPDAPRPEDFVRRDRDSR